MNSNIIKLNFAEFVQKKFQFLDSVFLGLPLDNLEKLKSINRKLTIQQMKIQILKVLFPPSSLKEAEIKILWMIFFR